MVGSFSVRFRFPIGEERKAEPAGVFTRLNTRYCGQQLRMMNKVSHSLKVRFVDLCDSFHMCHMAISTSKMCAGISFTFIISLYCVSLAIAHLTFPAVCSDTVILFWDQSSLFQLDWNRVSRASPIASSVFLLARALPKRLWQHPPHMWNPALAGSKVPSEDAHPSHSLGTITATGLSRDYLSGDQNHFALLLPLGIPFWNHGKEKDIYGHVSFRRS